MSTARSPISSSEPMRGVNVAPVSITDAPADDQLVQHENETYTTVQEGLAYILVPPDVPRLLNPKTHATDPAQSVFYNPIQQYNRDLTILAIRAFGEDMLARQSLMGKKRKGKHGRGRQHAKASHSTGKDAAQKAVEENIEGEVGRAEDASKQRKLSVEEPEDAESKERKADASVAVSEQPGVANKRKIDGELHEDTESKRQKLTSDTAEFEDEGIDDEDLIAVESSMRDNAPSSTAKAPDEAAGELGKSSDTVRTSVQEERAEHDARPRFRILDALSATGLRALRYAQELPFNTLITANDLSTKAVEAIKLNVKHNRLEKKIKTSVGNANAHMYNFVGQESIGGPGTKYHVIDIDPYGSAVPFLDAAVQALADNGMLCVTCTDTGVFNSMGYAEKAFALYGGLPARGDHCHEAGVRLILHAISTVAAKNGIAIEPLLSLSIDYYARVFVRVTKSPADVKFLASKTMLVYACDHGCGAWSPQFLMRATEQQGKKGGTWHKHSVAQGPSTDRLCECCGNKMHLAGPMWGGPLHNPSFVQKVLDLVPEMDERIYKTLPRIEGMLSLAQEEMAVQELDKLTASNEVAKLQKLLEKNRPSKDEDVAEKQADVANVNGSEHAAKANGNVSTKSTETGGKCDTDSAEHLKRIYEPLSPSAIDWHPFYVIPSSISRVLRCQAPSDAQFRGALKGLGFQAVRSHAQPGSIKTDASWDAIWDIMVAWTKEKPIREGALKVGMAGFQILKKAEAREKERLEAEKEKKEKENETAGEEGGRKEPVVSDQKHADEARLAFGGRKIVFDENLGKEPPKNRRMVRYQLNPRANWGPMARAK